MNPNKVISKKFKAPYVPQQKDLNPIDIDPECKKILVESDDIPEQIKKLIDKQQDNFKSFGKNLDQRRQQK